MPPRPDAGDSKRIFRTESPIPQAVRVLLVEDDEDDYVLCSDLLAEIGEDRFILEWAESYGAAVGAVARQEHDVYLVDFHLGQHTGLELLHHPLLAHRPVIMLTGVEDREIDLEAMVAGATDYLVKGRIDAPTLERAIRYAIQRGRAEEALCLAHDELECRVRERTAELEQANAALQEADRRKDEFLAMLGHELRNPLAAIRNGLYVLRLSDSDPAGVQRAGSVMERQVNHLTRMVEDLLDVSRITSGAIRLHLETVELASVVEHAIDSVRPLIQAKQQHLTVSLPPQRLYLRADPTRLEQVLVNLLTNAIKFTGSRGCIGITAEQHTAEPHGDEVVIRIRDSGAGISEEFLPYVFDLFAQSPPALDRTQGGLGIGLTLVEKLVNLHGGRIEAHSPGLNEGSEFVVRLPILPADVGNRKGDPESPAPGGVRLRVLVVEDNDVVAETLKSILEIWGHDVRAARSGPDGVTLYRSYRPDVVLLDIGLPEMDGYEVARQLRQEPAQKRPLILALTGYGQEDDRRQALESGCDHHLTKPVQPEELQALLASAWTSSEVADG